MPTALELGPEGWKRYAPRRIGPPQESLSSPDERERLLAALRDVAKLLKREFGAARVVVFGSLARPESFTHGSDVDVAVEGLSGDYWKAWGVIEDAIPTRVVELVELEAASPALRSAIEDEGIAL